MITEQIAPAASKSFPSVEGASVTPVSVSVVAPDDSGAFNLLCPGAAQSSEAHSPTDVAPVTLRKLYWGATFQVVNTGSSTLAVETLYASIGV